ncbi:tetratricopeptide TPR_4 [[Leptolyngbya] sp. PCC 7376]|uniref:CHAT domain-containing protein n=1 Tax=[Leptolyngbya] sp. PCC 7376 TaxID=111781 RepID=UPI00029EE50A|nr:CHAT domain-containing protein [[Leptolyngbya] sp. PCC 7376]AFY38528.1 tetratricopeptide TPR_4 [[Leptolyngbya] sp. PCC 7376]
MVGFKNIRKIRYWLLGLAALFFCAFSTPVFAYLSPSATVEPEAPITEAIALTPGSLDIALTPRSLDHEAQNAYQLGQYQKAADLLQQAQQQYKQQGQQTKSAIALSNLSLTYQKLGQWDAADEAIQQAQQQLANQEVSLAVQAQILDVQGQLDFATGQLDSAIETWQQSEELYGQIEDPQRQILSRLHQAQAFQAQGLFNKVSRTLETLAETVSEQPDTLTKATILRQLGDNLRTTGNLDQAKVQLDDSLDIATRLQNPTLMAASNLSLGNWAQGKFNTAVEAKQRSEANGFMRQSLGYYQEATKLSEGELNTQATLNLMRLLISPSLPQWKLALQLYPSLKDSLATLAPSRTKVLAYVSLAENLITLRENQVANAPSWDEIATLLIPAQNQAQALQDNRSQSLVLGTLGHVYEKSQQWNISQELSREALAAAKQVRADDLSYQWEWQLGRVLKAQGQESEAIAAYTRAFNTLKIIRSDLVTANPDVRFSFREKVEPIYRELVQLLVDPVPEVNELAQLKANPKTQGTSSSQDQERLRQARDVMESLQVAELENFFQAACIDKTVSLDQVVSEQDTTAAAIYAILLGDRLEVVMKLPKKADLIHYSTPVARADIENLLTKYRAQLTKGRNVVEQGKTLYNWLLRPAAEQGLLSPDDLKTLIFVLDGNLRLIPMATLHDGNDFLVRKYAVSLVLGLEVRDPQILPTREELQVLAASLETPPPEEAQFYSDLPGVTKELARIESTEMPTTLLQDQAFTSDALTNALQTSEFNIVHLATHGQFGSDRQNTYILSADGRLGIDTLGQIFRGSRQADARLEMLILSACKTATGDSREVLGIAGAMVQSGARSAIATLWSVDDQASILFTDTLYTELAKPGISRAEAMRRAQVALLDRYPGRPRYWAPYVLVGSWR